MRLVVEEIVQGLFDRVRASGKHYDPEAAKLANERTAVGIVGERLVATIALIKALGGGWKASDLSPERRPGS